MKQGQPEPILNVAFFKTDGGNEPVQEWLKSLKREERKTIGEDLKTVQFGWPLGMPTYPKTGAGHMGSPFKHQPRDRPGVIHS